MYKKTTYGTSQLKINETATGEPIEKKVERIVTNGEGVEDGAPSIYTERKLGVLPEYDIRTDKWDLALDAMDGAHNIDKGRRMTSIEEREQALAEKAVNEKGTQEQKGGSDGGSDSAVAP